MIHLNNSESYIKTFGMLSLEQVSEKMNAANCFVLFSDYENQPCVILESLASGIPVIATKVGGIPELLNEKRGVLIEKNDSYALLEAMKNVLQKKSLR
jgi:glycosyltransferase involved in cell wall biosynthesis